jgi:hypothetical protein
MAARLRRRSERGRKHVLRQWQVGHNHWFAPKGFYGDRIDTNPPSFFFSMNAMDEVIGASFFTDSGKQWAYIMGRVKPRTSLPALQAKASALLKHQLATLKTFSDPRAQKVLPRTHVVLTPGGGGIQNMQNGYRDRLNLLQWIAALVLLVACANIANRLLVRGMSRRAEFSVRSALGVQRSRLVRQLLQESVVLSGMGGLLGLAVSYLGRMPCWRSPFRISTTCRSRLLHRPW